MLEWIYINYQISKTKKKWKENQEYTQENDEITQTKYITIKLYTWRKQRKKENKNTQNIWTGMDQRSSSNQRTNKRNGPKSKLTINQYKSKITDQEHTTNVNEWDQSKENERGMRLEREDHVLSNRMIRTWHA